jgi:hypothetical protein
MFVKLLDSSTEDINFSPGDSGHSVGKQCNLHVCESVVRKAMCSYERVIRKAVYHVFMWVIRKEGNMFMWASCMEGNVYMWASHMEGNVYMCSCESVFMRAQRQCFVSHSSWNVNNVDDLFVRSEHNLIAMRKEVIRFLYLFTVILNLSLSR